MNASSPLGTTTAPPRPPLEPLADLKARLDLLAVVAGHVALKRRGQHEHSGGCPFHADRSPSLRVDPRRGTYHCFGCGAHGDVLDFLAAVEGLDLTGAIRRAHELAGGTVERRTPPPQPEPERKPRPFSALDAQRWGRARPIAPGTPAALYLATR